MAGYKYGGAAYQYTQEKLGGPITVDENYATVSISTLELLGGDPERVMFYVLNLGTGAVYISPAPDVTSGRGIIVPPNGGYISMNVADDFLLPSLKWYARVTAASTPLYYMTARRDTA